MTATWAVIAALALAAVAGVLINRLPGDVDHCVRDGEALPDEMKDTL